MITQAQIHEATQRLEFHRFQGTNSIVCALVMTNGHVVVGESHCAVGTEFDPAVGLACARGSAEGKVAELLAFQQRNEQLS